MCTPIGSPTRATRRSGRHDNVLGFSTIVKGDVDAALAGADVVVRGRFVTDPVQGVPIEPRAIVAAVAGRPRHDLVVDAGSLRRTRGRRPHARHPRVERPRDRAAPGRGFRREVRLPLRGPRRGPRARRGTTRQARLLAPRGVLRRRPPARGHGHRARDGRAGRRHPSCATGATGPRQRRLLRRGRVLRADGGDARARAVRARERRRRVVARLLEQPAVLVDPRADGAAGVLGARAAHGRARRGARPRSGRAPPAHADRGPAPSRPRARCSSGSR